MKTRLICLLALFSASSLTLADGVVCQSHGVLGAIETHIASEAVEIIDTTAFVLEWASLQVVDVSAPLTPTVISTTTLPNGNTDMKILGSTMFVSNHKEGLVIVDISSLSNPIVISSLDNLGRAYHIDAVGATAYITNNRSEMHIVDVSTPSTPTLLGTYTNTETINDLAAVGSRVYLAGTDVHILDVSDPAHPMLIGVYETAGAAPDIIVNNTTAFIAESSAGLSIVDMSYASTPILLGTYHTARSIREISLDGARVHAIGSSNRLTTVDVSDLSSPSLVGITQLPSAFEYISVSNGLAAVAGAHYDQMQLVDVSNPTIPKPVATFTPTLDYASNITTEGDYAYVVDRQAGLLVYDITTPLSPLLLSTTILLSSPKDITVHDSVVYICGGTSGLYVYDVSTPSSPIFIGHHDSPDFLQIKTDGQYVYARGFGQIGVFDVSDPANPVLIGIQETDEFTSDFTIRDSIIYLASGYTTLEILDATNPKSIQSLQRMSVNNYPEFTSGIAMMNDTLFVSTDHSKMHVFDVSNPSSPLFLTTTPTNINPNKMAVDGTNLVMFASGLYIYDASNPLDLQWRGSHEINGNELTLNGSHLIAAGGPTGFYIVNISDCDDCTADFTGDGALDFFDVSAFLGAFAAQDSIADFNDDGLWNFFDISDFLASFSAGCP